MVEVEALKTLKDIEKMKKAFSNERDRLLFVLGINVGLRISDLLQLKIKDVLQDEVIITEQKTNKIRTFTINKAARNAIKNFLGNEYNIEDFLFKSRKGDNPISRVAAWQVLNAAAARANIKGRIGTHTLRKTFGYWSYKQGIDITLLQRIFNHSTPAITLRYIGITKDDIKDVYNSLNL